MDRYDPPNVLLVVLDCVRAKSLKYWGGAVSAKTPELDRLAERSIVFQRAVAPSNWTVPSHSAMITGTPSAILPADDSKAYPGTLSDWLRRTKGYDTALFTENQLLVAGLGLERGFSVVRSTGGVTSASLQTSAVGPFVRGYRRVVYGDKAVSVLRRFPAAAIPFAVVENLRYQTRKQSYCNSQIARDFAQWLAGRHGDSPYFALINIMDAHEPFRNPSEWSKSGLRETGYRLVFRNHALMVPQLRGRIPWEDLENGYRWEIGMADAKVGEILRSVENHEDADRTIVIVTSDHGQCLGESGFVYHGDGVADACSRVPLLVHVPGAKPAQYGRWVSLTEIPGWIDSWTEGRRPTDALFDGTSPDGDRDDRVVYCDGRPASDSTQLLRGRFRSQPWNRRLIAAYQGNTKYVADAETRAIYRWNLEFGDPDRTSPRRLEGREGKETWRRLIEPYVDRQRPTMVPSRSTEEDARVVTALKSWGYE